MRSGSEKECIDLTYIPPSVDILLIVLPCTLHHIADVCSAIYTKGSEIQCLVMQFNV